MSFDAVELVVLGDRLRLPMSDVRLQHVASADETDEDVEVRSASRACHLHADQASRHTVELAIFLLRERTSSNEDLSIARRNTSR
jgi:hypothetical protein